MNKNPPELTVPPLLISLFCAPIFFINLLLPALPQSSLDFAINDFLDNQLFGLSGFWSSLFPFSSKATANYVATVGPIFAPILFYKIYKTMKIDPAQYKNRILTRFITGIFFTAFMIMFFILAFYLTETDLGKGTGKYGNLFGQNILFYSIFSSGMLILFFVIPFLIHRIFFYFPYLLIKNWKEKRERRHSH